MISFVIPRIITGVILGALGWLGATTLGHAVGSSGSVLWGASGTVAGVILGGPLFPYVIAGPARAATRALESVPTYRIVSVVAGLALGLVIAALMAVPLARLPGAAGAWIPPAVSILFALAGILTMVSRERDIVQILPGSFAVSTNRARSNGKVVVDTSAIIDGRIADISQTGFLGATLVVPRFVLDELRHIADSNDPLRRNRGRRGLEVLNELRKDGGSFVQVLDLDRWNGMEVDGKLVMLAKNLGAPIVTTDFNLNRVAEIQGVSVLNVNELANALKSTVIPGEEIRVQVIQEGKELGQGVGFLDDGTMIVVENGKRYVGSSIEAVVTRVLQTAAGRLIFTQVKGR